jgi:hypothetical protein
VITYNGWGQYYYVNELTFEVDEEGMGTPPEPTVTPTTVPTEYQPPTVTPTPYPDDPTTPDPDPVPLPIPPDDPVRTTLELRTDSAAVQAGETFAVNAIAPEVNQSVDVYLVARLVDGRYYFFSKKGKNGFAATPLIAGVRLPNGWTGTVAEFKAPSRTGDYTVLMGLFPAGTPPRVNGGAVGGIASIRLSITP